MQLPRFLDLDPVPSAESVACPLAESADVEHHSGGPFCCASLSRLSLSAGWTLCCSTQKLAGQLRGSEAPLCVACTA